MNGTPYTMNPYNVNPLAGWWRHALPGVALVVVWLALLALLFLFGCAAPTPTNEVVDAPAHQAEALQLLDLVDAGDVSITWMAGDCLEPTGLPGCVDGLAVDGCDLYVLRKFSIRASSLVHELMHCRSYLEIGDADPEHSSARWQEVAQKQAQLWRWEQCIVWPNHEGCAR